MWNQLALDPLPSRKVPLYLSKELRCVRVCDDDDYDDDLFFRLWMILKC